MGICLWLSDCYFTVAVVSSALASLAWGIGICRHRYLSVNGCARVNVGVRDRLSVSARVS